MLTWVMSTALAGSVFVNGVNVDALRSQTFEGCTVTIDSQGNILVTAPGYEIQTRAPGSTAAATPPPVSPTPPPAAPVPTPAPYIAPPTPTIATATPAPEPPVQSALAGRFWLVTEDNASAGHSVEVTVNGIVVRTVRSGEPQLILDLGPWLRAGTNTVRMSSNSVNSAGGSLYVYVGSGNNTSGTVVLDRPQIQYGLGSSRMGSYSRDYTFDVLL